MFNFQKEVVLNSLDKAKVVTFTSSLSNTIDKKVRFHDGGEYYAKYISEGKIYKTEPIVGTATEIRFKADQLATIDSDHIQIFIELGLDNNYRGDFGSALWYFRKPVVIDIVPTGLTAKSLAKAFRTAIPEEYKFLHVYAYGDTDIPTKNGEANITALNEHEVLLLGEDSYIKVRKIEVVKFDCETRCEGSSEEPIIEAELVKDSTGMKIGTNGKYGSVIKNNCEFGTYDYVIHNLRFPSYANMRFVSPNADEMPVKNGKYIQYSFMYCVPRVGFGGLSVVGQTNYSTTLHTFYVLSTLESEFEQLFKDLGLSDPFVEVGRDGNHVVTILPDSYASSQDLKLAAELSDNAAADEELADRVEAVETKNTQQDSTIASKADASNVYTKAEVYTKTESDNKYEPKA